MSVLVVHKHQISPHGNETTVLDLTAGARVLHVAEQRGALYLWEVHEADEPRTELREFVLAGTGFAVEAEPDRFVGTALCVGGALVFHLFEVTP